MLALFDIRNTLKKKTHTLTKSIYIKEREVWYAHLWMNIWFEQNGVWSTFVRPVLIVKRVGTVCFVVPMTTWWKENKYYYTLSDHCFWKTSRIILSQARCIDKKRLTHKLWMLAVKDFEKIKKKLTELLL